MRAAIVGGGILGFAVGLAFLESQPDSHITVFDKENQPGSHASTRNSGVLHSGIYYSSDSLKAKFSVQGNIELKKLCHDADIPILESGKLIVAQNEAVRPQLEKLMGRAEANGVAARLHSQSEIGKFAPGALTHGQFIHVQTTAVSSPTAIMGHLVERFIKLGGHVVLGFGVERLHVTDAGNVEIPGVEADVIVNVAGNGALKLARQVGVGLEYRATPFLGLYWSVDSTHLPLPLPIYPVPHPINPFLGVHLTPSVKSQTKIGPTAIPVLSGEQYSINEGWDLSSGFEALAGYIRLARGSHHRLTQLMASELPKFIRGNMVREAATLYPPALGVRNWKVAPAGIRSQLVDDSGLLVQDFVVKKQLNSVHVLNSVSPGWTSALPFGRWIVNKYVNQGA